MSDPLHIWSVDRMLVCVPAQLPDPTLAALRALLAGEPSVDAVLDLLTADGLAATPSFLCAEVTGEGVRVVIRGSLRAVANGLDGSSLELGAGRAATWNDDVVTDIAGISFALGDPGGRFEWLAATGGPPLRAPARTASPHTLDEGEFQRLVTSEPELELEPEPEQGREPDPEPEPAREQSVPAPPDPVPAPATPQPSPPVAESTDPADELDFSSLLDHTSHEPPAVPAAPVSPAPPAPAPTPPPARPAGVVPPPPTTRTPISAVPPAGAAAPATVPNAPEPTGGTGLGEHDGRTVTLADLRRLQEEAGAVAPAPTGVDLPIRPSEVRAVRCPAGHPNPPTATTCRLCAAAIADTTVAAVPRPVIARLAFESGLVVDVDRPQLIGRRPTAPPGADELPNLVTIPSPDSDLSRIHTAVRVEGWDVLVEDVGSTNGTEVRLPGREPVRLREHEPVLVVAGTEVTLAGTVRFRIDPPEA